MRPEGVESNHFAYHLDQLIKDGFIIKADKRYTLSPKGLSYVDRMSQKKMTDRVQPHIVTAIDITNSKGETLLFKRSFQPYIYKMSFPLGKTHYDETIQEAAKRELAEKTDLTDVPLVYRGDLYIHSRQDGQTISKILCHVFSGKTDTVLPPKSDHRGTTLWAQVSDYNASDFMPGFLRTKELLQGGSELFFDEIVEDI
jgi:8-oxo-dGTP pyrophosphatase MutT (NUDIX family)